MFQGVTETESMFRPKPNPKPKGVLVFRQNRISEKWPKFGRKPKPNLFRSYTSNRPSFSWKTLVIFNYRGKFNNQINFFFYLSIRIWIADILMFNSASAEFNSAFKTLVTVKSDGWCEYIPPGNFKSTCQVSKLLQWWYVTRAAWVVLNCKQMSQKVKFQKEKENICALKFYQSSSTYILT